MDIKVLQVGSIGTNCYILCEETEKLCAVIDPGGDARLVATAVEQTGCALAFILLTHGHYDHTGGVAELLEFYPQAAVYIHKADYLTPHHRLFPLRAQVPAVKYYDEGDTLTLGSLELQVLHTPGHSEGSVTLRCGDVLFCGDTLFAGSCGRTDLAGGSMQEMMRSLGRLGALEGTLYVLPGHMGTSDLDTERRWNPYLIQAMKQNG